MSINDDRIALVTDLLHKVPAAPGEPVPQGVADITFSEFSDRTGIDVPPALAVWLRLTNGPCVGPGGIFGIRPNRENLDIEFHYGLFPVWKSRKWIPVASDGCGNYYVLATNQEFGPGDPILFIETTRSAEEPEFIVASDLLAFLRFLLEKELGQSSWPFDEEEVTQKDPAILNFQGVRLPWSAG